MREGGRSKENPCSSRDHCKLLQIQGPSLDPKLRIGEPHNCRTPKRSAMTGRKMKNAFSLAVDRLCQNTEECRNLSVYVGRVEHDPARMHHADSLRFAASHRPTCHTKISSRIMRAYIRSQAMRTIQEQHERRSHIVSLQRIGICKSRGR